MDAKSPHPALDARIADSLARKHRWGLGEVLFWLVAFASLFFFKERHLILNEIAIWAVFALSLDLILGYAGLVSLGHAAFFGTGAYVAGLLAIHWTQDPLLGLLASGVVGGALGFVTSFLVLRGSDLTRLMVTLGVSLVLYEIANRNAWLTGGADGLQGVTIAPILGRFEFDLYGTTAYAYSLVTLFVLFLIARRIVNSPFGLSLRAIRDNRLRANAIGIPAGRRLVAIYTVSGVYAAIAGALLAQTTAFVSLEVFDFARSADVLLFLVIGGTGYLYGGLIGALLFRVVQEVASSFTPQYWYFWIGLLLVILVLIGRDRISRWVDTVFGPMVRRLDAVTGRRA